MHFTALGRIFLNCLGLLGVLLLTACGPDATSLPVSSKTLSSPETDRIDTRPIAPSEFVVTPCKGVPASAPCAVIAAGGKRILIGAPAGVGDGMIAGDKISIDAVIAFSLRASALEGLDEIRNHSWTSERRTALTVAGAHGIGSIVDGLNAAYETPDALAYVSGEHGGLFDTVPIVAKEVGAGEVAFDSGDLVIRAYAAGPGTIALLVEYNTHSVLISDCTASLADMRRWPKADVYIGCLGRTEQIASKQIEFPPNKRLYVN